MEFLQFMELFEFQTSNSSQLVQTNMTQIAGNASEAVFRIEFPGPFYEIIYDPNFGVILTSSQNGKVPVFLFMAQNQIFRRWGRRE